MWSSSRQQCAVLSRPQWKCGRNKSQAEPCKSGAVQRSRWRALWSYKEPCEVSGPACVCVWRRLEVKQTPSSLENAWPRSVIWAPKRWQGGAGPWCGAQSCLTSNTVMFGITAFRPGKWQGTKRVYTCMFVGGRGAKEPHRSRTGQCLLIHAQRQSEQCGRNEFGEVTVRFDQGNYSWHGCGSELGFHIQKQQKHRLVKRATEGLTAYRHFSVFKVQKI